MDRILFILACAALATVIAVALVDWRRRVSIWKTAPERLVEPVPQHPVLHTGCVLLGGAVAVAILVEPQAWLAPLAAFTAALAVLTVGHRSGLLQVSQIGLLIAAEGVVMMMVAWLPAAPTNVLAGVSLAGMYLLWLAKFWQQQLDDGRAWTTTGRLIPAARQLSYVAGITAAALLCVFAAVGLRQGAPRGWVVWLAVALAILHWVMIVRDVRRVAASARTAATR